MAGSAFTALYCFIILCCCRRRKKKEEEKKIYIREIQKVAVPIWIASAVDSDSSDEEQDMMGEGMGKGVAKGEKGGTTTQRAILKDEELTSPVIGDEGVGLNKV